MTDRPRLFTSSPSVNLPRHRSHSCRIKATRPTDDLYRQPIERIQRDFERDLDQDELELQWRKTRRSDSFSSTKEYLEHVRTKIKNDYNQRMQEKIEEVERYMGQHCDDERRLSQRKFRKAQIQNEKLRLQSINHIVRERDAICEEKLAAQRSLFNRLLAEQAQRLHAEKRLQSFEHLNIEQLKDRLTRVEHSNYELEQLIRNLINQKLVYKSTIYVPKLR